MISNDFGVLYYLRVSAPWHHCGGLVTVFTGVTPSRCPGNGSLWTQVGRGACNPGHWEEGSSVSPAGRGCGSPNQVLSWPLWRRSKEQTSLMISLPRRGGGPLFQDRGKPEEETAGDVVQGQPVPATGLPLLEASVITVVWEYDPGSACVDHHVVDGEGLGPSMPAGFWCVNLL